MKRQYFMFFKRKMWFYLELAFSDENDIVYYKLYNFQYKLVNKNFTFGYKEFEDVIELLQRVIFNDSNDSENEIETLLELSKEEFDFLIV